MQKKKNLLETAQRYLEIGFAPIPCHAPHLERKCTCRLGVDCVSPGKHPAIPWQRFQTKKIDQDQLLIWFGEGGMYEDKNIGLITGAISSNIFAIDVDIGPGKDGADSLHQLQMANDDLPPTMETVTGGHGRHLFFRAPPGVRIITDKNVLGRGVDVRGEGGFVVAGGSVHANGREYVCDFDAVVDSPGWLIDLVVEGAHHEGHGRGLQASTNSDNPFKADDGREGVMVRVILSTICNYFRDNQRLPTEQQLVEIGFPIYVEKVKSRADSLDTEGRGIKLFTLRASYQLYRAKRGDLRVLQKTKEDLAAPASRDGTIAQSFSPVAVQAAPVVVADDEDDWDKPGVATEIASEIVVKREQLRITDWSIQRFVGEPPAVQWLIEGIIPRGIPMLLAAIGGLGKSFLSLDLAMKVAGGGSSWDDEAQFALGGKVVAAGPVVFLTAEDSSASIHRRLDKIGNESLRNKAKKNMYVVPLPDAGGAFPFISEDSNGLHHTPGYAELRKQLLAMGDVSLIIFDPLQAFVHADVTADPAAAQFWWSTMSELCAVTKATIMVSHHMRKEGSFSIKRASDARQAIRGTTALVDGARLVYGLWSLPDNEDQEICKLLELEPGQNNVACGAVVKSNEFADQDIRTFKRGDSGLLVDCTGEIDELMADAASVTGDQKRAIFKEIDKRWANGAPFSPSPRARTNSLIYWLVQSYALPKKIAEKKMLGWMNNGDLVAAHNDQAKQQGLKVSAAGAPSHTPHGGSYAD
jgi:hypothetical protein